MTEPLTARQQVVLDCIRDYIAKHHFPPTFREIAAACGIKSPNGIASHLRLLERKGAIVRRHFGARCIEIVQEKGNSHALPVATSGGTNCHNGAGEAAGHVANADVAGES